MANPVVEYFQSIYKAFRTTLIGLKITSRHFFHVGTKPWTVQYPDVDMLAPPDEQSRNSELSHRIYQGYRGLIEMDPDICIACSACERTCPIDCISIEVVRTGKHSVTSAIDGSERNSVRAPVSMIIDLSKCMYCGFCSEACPTAALRHTRHFAGSATQIDGLVYQFVSPEKRRHFEELAEQAEKEKAAADAEKAKKAKAADGEAADKKKPAAAEKKEESDG